LSKCAIKLANSFPVQFTEILFRTKSRNNKNKSKNGTLIKQKKYKNNKNKKTTPFFMD
tara:strand:- start:493 stop:666 length:174 start_codon:yes stop_codon:yes gene_type:complete